MLKYNITKYGIIVYDLYFLNKKMNINNFHNSEDLNIFNKAKNFYKNTEKSSIQSQDPIAIVKNMVGELKRSMDKVITSTGVDSQRQFRAKYFSRSLVIIYTLQTSLDFEKEENLAAKLFQLYEFCRQQLIKCFREQVVEGVKKAMNALEEIFVMNNMKNNER